MSCCIAGLAVALMVLKMFTWVTFARFHASGALNAAYVASTLLMLWSYVLAVGILPVSHPLVDNRVRVAHHLEEGGGGLSTTDGNSDEEEDDGDREREATRYCERCDMQKPAQVHHCSTCHRCVYRMVQFVRCYYCVMPALLNGYVMVANVPVVLHTLLLLYTL